MDTVVKLTALVAFTVIFGGCLIYVFRTKIEGFGPLTTGLPIVLAVLFFASLLAVFDKIDAREATSLIFVALGYGGGLLTAKIAKN